MTKILLVEDDKSLREIYGVRLLAEGYDIVSAGDGEEALAMAIKERPQLIVSDVMMPKISGFDMLDILRSTTETKGIKVIMMTALSSEDQRARGVALGADRYLVKSQVGIEDVVRTVHEVLGDAPVSSSFTNQAFSTPVPNAASRPSTNMAPRLNPVTVPSHTGYQPPQPLRPPPSPASFQTAPPPSRPVQQSPTTNLPQPTAPFSTPRPANLGERIIHPIAVPAHQAQKSDLGSLMDQELNKTSDQPQSSIPEDSTIPPVPPTPLQSMTPQADQSPAPQQQPSSPPIQQESGINFEETPRPPLPPSPNPFGAQPQPPRS